MQEYKEHYDGSPDKRDGSAELRKPPPQKYFFPNHLLNMTSKEYNEFIEYMNSQVNFYIPITLFL